MDYLAICNRLPAGRDFTAAKLGMHKLKIERLKKKAVEQGFLDG